MEDQDRWQSDVVARFESALDAKLRRVEAQLFADLSSRLILDGDRIRRSPANVQAMRWLGPAFARQMEREGYGALVTAFVAQFPGQYRFFEESMQLLGLNPINWAKRDLDALRAHQLSSIDTLKSVVAQVSENAKRKALMSISGISRDALIQMLQEEYGKTVPQSVALGDTLISIHYAQMADAGYRRYEEAGIEFRLRYYGPSDRITRPFCEKLLAAGRSYTRAEIAAMDNGQIPNVLVSRGGYRCRHQWILDIDTGDVDQAPRDEAPLVKGDPADVDLKAKVDRAILSMPQPVRKLLSKSGPITVASAPPGVTPGYASEIRTLQIHPEIAEATITHELGHHVDWQLGKSGATASTNLQQPLGRQIHRELDYFSRVIANEELRSGFRMEVDAAANLFISDLFGALTFNKIGGGHDDTYFMGPDGKNRRIREIFANLFVLFSAKNDWSRVKRLLPELAKAFEEWVQTELS